MVKIRNTQTVSLHCRAEFIFDTRRRGNGAHPIKVLSECMCDCRRPDWESRWKRLDSAAQPLPELVSYAQSMPGGSGSLK